MVDFLSLSITDSNEIGCNLIQTPSLLERAQQGREVGYAIIAVGIIAVFFAFYKLYSFNIIIRFID